MTRREREITMRVASGENDIDISRQLKISTSAVRSHISNILETMALRSHLQSGDDRRGPPEVVTARTFLHDPDQPRRMPPWWPPEGAPGVPGRD